MSAFLAHLTRTIDSALDVRQDGLGRRRRFIPVYLRSLSGGEQVVGRAIVLAYELYGPNVLTAKKTSFSCHVIGFDPPPPTDIERHVDQILI